MRTALALTAFVVTAGCLGGGPTTDAVGLLPETPAAASFSVAGVAREGCTGSFRSNPCFEPVIAAGPGGELYVSTVPGDAIFASTDGGMNWSVIEPPPIPFGSPPRPLRGDGTVHVDRDGRLFYSALLSTPELGANIARAYLAGIQVSRSDDGGATWATNVYLPTGGADRQWVVTTPDAVYLSFWQIPSGLWVVRSDDGGATFGVPIRAVATEKDGFPGPSGPPIVTPDGRVMLLHRGVAANPQGNVGVVRAAVSDDRGLTFSSLIVSSDAAWAWPVAALSTDDAVVAAWTRVDGSIRVTRSTDGGDTWEDARDWGPGSLDADSVFLGDGPGVRLLWMLDNGDIQYAEGPFEGPAAVLDVATGVGDIYSDFAWLAGLPDGGAAVAWSDGEAVRVSVMALGP